MQKEVILGCNNIIVLHSNIKQMKVDNDDVLSNQYSRANYEDHNGL